MVGNNEGSLLGDSELAVVSCPDLGTIPWGSFCLFFLLICFFEKGILALLADFPMDVMGIDQILGWNQGAAPGTFPVAGRSLKKDKDKEK